MDLWDCIDFIEVEKLEKLTGFGFSAHIYICNIGWILVAGTA